MSTQYTPGPWEIDGMGNLQQCVAICAGKRPEGPESQRESLICEVYGDASDPNARLIAAAPDMCAALREISNMMSLLKRSKIGNTTEHYCMMIARNAVAKAEERTSPAHRCILDIYGSTPASLDRDFYKSTACGGHATLNADGTVAIHTIVEGSDAEYTDVLPYNATKRDIRRAVAAMERWADAAWKEANQ
ncbi:MAG: hypothetical protein HC888_03465 [Candidatus Competibacteraceae bacterium]|nr:hypothetical protein [Candidatus Competibacteraceae bacterium]